jgi:hypothetical protein
MSTEEKIPQIDEVKPVKSVEYDDSTDKAGDVDGAWKFLNAHRDAAPSVDIKALRRKIDFHIVPLMFLCYTMQFLDKVIINVSSLLSPLARWPVPNQPPGRSSPCRSDSRGIVDLPSYHGF